MLSYKAIKTSVLLFAKTRKLRFLPVRGILRPMRSHASALWASGPESRWALGLASVDCQICECRTCRFMRACSIVCSLVNLIAKGKDFKFLAVYDVCPVKSASYLLMNALEDASKNLASLSSIWAQNSLFVTTSKQKELKTRSSYGTNYLSFLEIIGLNLIYTISGPHLKVLATYGFKESYAEATQKCYRVILLLYGNLKYKIRYLEHEIGMWPIECLRNSELNRNLAATFPSCFMSLTELLWI